MYFLRVEGHLIMKKEGICLVHTKGLPGRQNGQALRSFLFASKIQVNLDHTIPFSKTTIEQNKSQGSIEAGVICFTLAKMMNMHPHINFYCMTIIIVADSKYRATDEKIQKKIFYCTIFGL